MQQKYEPWLIQLLDDFWAVFYPGIPRKGNAGERKCRTIEQEIQKNISASSLYNYFNQKGSVPADGTKGIMCYYILQHWQREHPDQLTDIPLKEELKRNESADRYLMLYRRYRKQFRQKNAIPFIAETPISNQFEWIHLNQFKLVRWIGLACFVGIGVLLLGLIYQMNPITSELTETQRNALASTNHDKFLISILHICTIPILLFFYYLPSERRRAPMNGFAGMAIKQFELGWLGLWISWILLYLWLSIKYSVEKGYLLAGDLVSYAQFTPWSWAVADAVSALSSICFFYLFFVMDMKTISIDGEKEKSNQFKRSMIFVILLTTALLSFSIIDQFMLHEAWNNTGTLLYSILTSIAMLYFFARLDSHLFHARRIYLAPLFLYAVIQVNWNNLPDSSFATKGFAILFLAFLLKIYFFFVINNWLKGGDFERYFLKIRELYIKENQ